MGLIFKQICVLRFANSSVYQYSRIVASLPMSTRILIALLCAMYFLVKLPINGLYRVEGIWTETR